MGEKPKGGKRRDKNGIILIIKCNPTNQVVENEAYISRNKRKMPTIERAESSFDIWEKRCKEPRRNQVDVLKDRDNSFGITFKENI